MNKLIHVAKQFEKRGISARVFPSRSEALGALLETIKDGQTTAFGGSMTLQELGAYEALMNSGKNVLWHWRVSGEKVPKLLKDAMNADVYVSSSNAVIEDGRLLNIDGVGNRTAALFFGPPRVIIIAGKNKLAPDYSSALERIKTVACPKNAERLNRNLPCRITGKCQDCRSPERICQVSVLIENNLNQRSLEVWLVNEELGF
ncbi:lactate utilization protein [Clostridium sp. OS1-26]|uniref:lactate utilization protein n=1 Tax=Clostridium sp. OS1-26 TaxID=3070681 RepID=UPI0027E0ED6E|nr:lactate utilization protein [Clostridium sp. OS1-26]WML37650.1 lactate utilization protein [Clostridium sp. OS1-26]